MGKNFKGTLERGRRGAEQGGMRGMVQGLQDGFRGIPEPEVPRMAGEAQELKQAPAPQAPAFETAGRYRKVGDFRNFR